MTGTASPSQVPIEDPYSFLVFDAATIPPYEVLNRRIAITNALVQQFQKLAINREIAGGVSKSSVEYKQASLEKAGIDQRINALKKKLDVLEGISFMKSAEARLANH